MRNWPWDWMAVTAYATTLAWALAGDISAGDQTVIAVLSEWQTGLVGLGTFAALIYAARQLANERDKERRSYLQSHTAEWEALEALKSDLDTLKNRKSPVVGALMRLRSGYAYQDLDISRWERLNTMCVAAIDGPLREFMSVTKWFDDFNRSLNVITSHPLSGNDRTMLEGFMARLHDTDAALRSAIDRRQQELVRWAP